MAASIFAPALLAGAAAAAIFMAPIASADPSDELESPRGTASAEDRSPNKAAPSSRGRGTAQEGFSPDLPKGWLNETQFARPGTNPFGAGPMPSILALE